MINFNAYSSYSESVEAAIDALVPLIRSDKLDEAAILIAHIKEGVDIFLSN